jgi:hypothetical protein
MTNLACPGKREVLVSASICGYDCTPWSKDFPILLNMQIMINGLLSVHTAILLFESSFGGPQSWFERATDGGHGTHVAVGVQGLDNVESLYSNGPLGKALHYAWRKHEPLKISRS